MRAAIWMHVASGLVAAFSIASGGARARDLRHFTGLASVYSADYSGRTADGEIYDPKKLTCAHRTLPFGTRLRIKARNGHSVDVVVNDRGPFVNGRVLDLSLAAAKALRIVDSGIAEVSARVR